MGAIDVRQGWKDFQARQGLVPDGKPGQLTLDAVVRLESNVETEPTIGKYHLGKTSLDRIAPIHPDLRAVVMYAIKITLVDFGIPRTGGLRTPAMQKVLREKGKSRTLNSRHLTGHAVDVYAYRSGDASWTYKDALRVHNAFARASRALSVPLRWGGDWDGDGDLHDQKFVDAFHHELPVGIYGDSMESRSETAKQFLADELAKLAAK